MATIFVFPGSGASGHMADPRKGWQRILDRDELLQLASRIEEAGGSFEINLDQPEQPNFDYLAIALSKARQLAQEMEIDTAGARLTNIRPHDLRRTLGSWQAKTGAGLVIIAKSLGHRSLAAASIYAHLNLDPVRGSVDTATKAMLVAAGVKQPAQVTPITKGKRRAKTA